MTHPNNRRRFASLAAVTVIAGVVAGLVLTYMQVLTFYRLPITPAEDATLSKVCAS